MVITPEYMTVKDVAAFCRISEARVRTYIHSGIIPAAKLGGTFRVRKEDIEAWIEDCFAQAARKTSV